MARADWLSDDEGNLTPAAARVVAQGEPRPRRPAPVQHIARGATPSVARTLRQVVIWTSAALVAIRLIGCLADRHHAPAVAIVPQPVPSASVAPVGETEHTGIPQHDQGADGARIIGDNVVLRAAPTRESEDVGRLWSGDAVRLTGTQSGWCAVATANAGTGWVFGAYVRGGNVPWVGPAVVTRMLSVQRANGTALLRPGDKVLVLRQAQNSVVVALPEGEQIEIPVNAAVLLE